MAIENDITVIENNSIFNKGSVQLQTDSFHPKWLNKCFVESHLQNYFSSKNLKIVRFNVEPATAKGENYASDLYRVKVTFSENLNGVAIAEGDEVNRQMVKDMKEVFAAVHLNFSTESYPEFKHELY